MTIWWLEDDIDIDADDDADVDIDDDDVLDDDDDGDTVALDDLADVASDRRRHLRDRQDRPEGHAGGGPVGPAFVFCGLRYPCRVIRDDFWVLRSAGPILMSRSAAGQCAAMGP